MLRKSAEDLINIMCMEKEAGLGETIKSGVDAVKGTAKNVLGDTANTAKNLYGDVKKATGLEKYTPKHDVGVNALKGAAGGAAVGAASAVATNSGDNKDDFGAALKGGALGAVGGAALGGGLSHHLNSEGAKAFTAQNNAFKRGFGLGSVTGGVAGHVGVDGVANGINAVKNATPQNVKSNLTGMYDKVKSKVDEATKNVNDVYGKAQDTAKNVSSKAQDAVYGKAKDITDDAGQTTKVRSGGFVDSVKAKLDKLKGHQ